MLPPKPTAPSGNPSAKQPGAPELPCVAVPEIDRCIQTGIYEKTFSAAVCIASVGRNVFHRAAYGNPLTPPPVRKVGMDVLFDLASLSKPLGAGLAALWLTSKSRVDLNASIVKTIPELRVPRFEKITIDMLLDHTSGLPARRSFWQDLRDAEAKLPEAQRVLGTQKAVPWFKARLGDTVLEADPGAKTVYSDLGFMALGWIVESLVGQPLDVFLEREIYRPLGIADDLFFVRLDDERRRQRLARRTFAATEDCAWRQKMLQGEVHDPNAWAMGGVAGHAGLFGSVDAVWKLVAALWESYKGDNRFFLGGTVKRFWTRSKRLPGTTRALAWDTPTVNNSAAGKRFSQASVGHLGFTGGSIWIDLSTDIIGVVLTNAAHPSPEGKQEALAKLRPRIYELIAKEGESLPADAGKATGSKAFYSGPIVGPSSGGPNPLRGPWR